MAKKLNQAERRKAREMAALRVEKDFLLEELKKDLGKHPGRFWCKAREQWQLDRACLARQDKYKDDPDSPVPCNGCPQGSLVKEMVGPVEIKRILAVFKDGIRVAQSEIMAGWTEADIKAVIQYNKEIGGKCEIKEITTIKEIKTWKQPEKKK